MGQRCTQLIEDLSKQTDGGSSPPNSKQVKPILSWQREGGVPKVAKGTFTASQNPADYAAVGLTGMKWQRLPGQINDQRINIDRCVQSQFFLVDQCDSVQVDECKECVFLIGPTCGSVFIRNCTDCVFVVACGQLRLRDVRRCKLSLLCTSRPVIENSGDLHLCCYSARHQYFMQATHLRQARMSMFNNLFWYVHDFTPSGKVNFQFMSQTQFESSYDAAIMRVQAQGQGYSTTLDAVPVLSAGVPEYVSPEEDLQMYCTEVVIPCTIGLSNLDAVHPSATLRTVLIFSSAGCDEAMQFVQAVELQRREYYALQGAGPPEQIVQLMATMEKIFTAEDVAQMLSVTNAQAFWSPVPPGEIKSANTNSNVAHVADRSPKVVDAAIRRLAGTAAIAVLVATSVENPPLLAVHRTVAAQAMRSAPTPLIALDVARPSACEAMQRLIELMFCKLPIAGMGFGSTH